MSPSAEPRVSRQQSSSVVRRSQLPCAPNAAQLPGGQLACHVSASSGGSVCMLERSAGGKDLKPCMPVRPAARAPSSARRFLARGARDRPGARSPRVPPARHEHRGCRRLARAGRSKRTRRHGRARVRTEGLEHLELAEAAGTKARSLLAAGSTAARHPYCHPRRMFHEKFIRPQPVGNHDHTVISAQAGYTSRTMRAGIFQTIWPLFRR